MLYLSNSELIFSSNIFMVAFYFVAKICLLSMTACSGSLRKVEKTEKSTGTLLIVYRTQGTILNLEAILIHI